MNLVGNLGPSTAIDIASIPTAFQNKMWTCPHFETKMWTCPHFEKRKCGHVHIFISIVFYGVFENVDVSTFCKTKCGYVHIFKHECQHPFLLGYIESFSRAWQSLCPTALNTLQRPPGVFQKSKRSAFPPRAGPYGPWALMGPGPYGPLAHFRGPFGSRFCIPATNVSLMSKTRSAHFDMGPFMCVNTVYEWYLLLGRSHLQCLETHINAQKRIESIWKRI